MSNLQKTLIVTHDGEFHADEVVGIALLKWVFKNIEIKRSRNPEVIQLGDFVLDVGGIYDSDLRRFDHHQKEYTGDLASAGMVLKWLVDKEKLDKDFGEYLQEKFVLGVDWQDTGAKAPRRGIASFSDIISSFNSLDMTISEEELSSRFNDALDFTYNHIERMWQRFEQKIVYRKSFYNYIANKEYVDKGFIVFDEPLPWKEFIFEEESLTDTYFIVMPVHQKKWIVHTIPENSDEMYSNRKMLPEVWAGLLEGQFTQTCGIDGAIFCHKQRFIAAFNSKNAAIKAAQFALSQ